MTPLESPERLDVAAKMGGQQTKGRQTGLASQMGTAHSNVEECLGQTRSPLIL